MTDLLTSQQPLRVKSVLTLCLQRKKVHTFLFNPCGPSKYKIVNIETMHASDSTLARFTSRPNPFLAPNLCICVIDLVKPEIGHKPRPYPLGSIHKPTLPLTHSHASTHLPRCYAIMEECPLQEVASSSSPRPSQMYMMFQRHRLHHLMFSLFNHFSIHHYHQPKAKSELSALSQ